MTQASSTQHITQPKHAIQMSLTDFIILPNNSCHFLPTQKKAESYNREIGKYTPKNISYLPKENNKLAFHHFLWFFHSTPPPTPPPLLL